MLEGNVQKLVDGRKSSGWVLVLQISSDVPGSFFYDSDLWTNNATLNPSYTDITSGVDVKLAAYNTQSLEALRLCVDSLERCYTVDVHANSSRELFAGPFRRRLDFDQEAIEGLFAHSNRSDCTTHGPMSSSASCSTWWSCASP